MKSFLPSSSMQRLQRPMRFIARNYVDILIILIAVGVISMLMMQSFLMASMKQSIDQTKESIEIQEQQDTLRDRAIAGVIESQRENTFVVCQLILSNGDLEEAPEEEKDEIKDFCEDKVEMYAVMDEEN